MADTATISRPLQRSSRLSDIQALSRPIEDPILPCLRLIAQFLDDMGKNPNDFAWTRFNNLLEECIQKFGNMERYTYDIRLLKVWILYADACRDFEKVYKLLEDKRQFLKEALLYEAYTIYLMERGDLLEAFRICKLGISRNAEPIGKLTSMYEQFQFRDVLNNLEDLHPKAKQSNNLTKPSSVYPWSTDLLEKIDPKMKKFSGFHRSNKDYDGKVSLAYIQKNQYHSRNKVVELGRFEYQIKGCSGKGGFATVFKACVDNNSDEVVALKIQMPSYPWEFYMYRLLDMRISGNERLNFGYAHRIHIYSDLSVLVCDFLSHGTLQDAINLHLVTNHHMDEVLCMYYTVELLYMLEILHGAGILHGDFKPDNLLIRYPSEEFKEDIFHDPNGSWRNQGLCLVDWGKGIDVNLFPDNALFFGDCKTSGFRCVEMQENREWKYQVDTYGLCVIVHMMLHGSYMSIEKKVNSDGTCHYQPKQRLKRYWNVELWRNLFSRLLNVESNEGIDVPVLKVLRESFEEYLSSDRKLVIKLNGLLAKQKASLCSS